MKNTYEFKSNGMTIWVEYEYVEEMINKTAYADGWNVDLGKEIYTKENCKVYVNGEPYTTGKPVVVNGIVGIGTLVIKSEENAAQVIKMIAETKAAGTTAEAKEAEEEAQKKEAVKGNAKISKSTAPHGLCPICHTYCDGDCQSH